MQRTIVLKNDITDIPQLSAFIDAFAEEAGLDFSLTMSLNLAIEEAVVNVMLYAYPQGMQGKVNLSAEAEGTDVKFVLSDTGKPFDPTEKKEVDTTLEVEDRPIGGLGIHLVRQIMDKVEYKYTDGMNVLTMYKNTANASGDTVNIDFDLQGLV